MKLAWYDRMAPHVVYELPRKGYKRDSLFEKESTMEYIKRFFSEIKWTGNIGVLKVTKGKDRLLFKRDL